ncbi:MAG: flagellar hook-length control protein FliK [Planctomycetota bacterium]
MRIDAGSQLLPGKSERDRGERAAAVDLDGRFDAAVLAAMSGRWSQPGTSLDRGEGLPFDSSGAQARRATAADAGGGEAVPRNPGNDSGNAQRETDRGVPAQAERESRQLVSRDVSESREASVRNERAAAAAGRTANTTSNGSDDAATQRFADATRTVRPAAGNAGEPGASQPVSTGVPNAGATPTNTNASAVGLPGVASTAAAKASAGAPPTNTAAAARVDGVRAGLGDSAFRAAVERGKAKSATPATTRNDRAAMEAQIARGLAAAMQRKDGTATLTLRPDGLGRLQVQVAVRQDVVTATFRATTEQARALLEASQLSLRGALESRGLQVDRLVIEPTDEGRGGAATREDRERSPGGSLSGQTDQQHSGSPGGAGRGDGAGSAEGASDSALDGSDALGEQRGGADAIVERVEGLVVRVDAVA